MREAGRQTSSGTASRVGAVGGAFGELNGLSGTVLRGAVGPRTLLQLEGDSEVLVELLPVNFQLHRVRHRFRWG